MRDIERISFIVHNALNAGQAKKWIFLSTKIVELNPLVDATNAVDSNLANAK